MLIEETLRGGYGGLYGEVVTEDCYKLKGIDFIPTCIIDIGANIGVFSRYARTLFHSALIVAIEPHKENCDLFKYFTKDDRIVLIEKAIGDGKVFHGLTAANGSGETYLSHGTGFPEEEMAANESMELCDVKTITVYEIADKYVTKDDKVVIKIDCEGSEHSIFSDKRSMDVLRKADYVAIELHYYALTAQVWQQSKDEAVKALKSLEETHICITNHVNFYARKK